MPRHEHGPVGFHVPGLYDRVRERELTAALSPDPRLYGLDPDERERVAATAPKYSPTALNRTEALLVRQPVRVPRRMLGGRTCPEVRGWPLYTDRRHQWFTVGPDDIITVVVAPSDANRSSGASQGEGPERHL